MQTKTYSTNTKEKVVEAVNELVDFVKTTYGCASNKVLISNGNGIDLIDDGVAIAKAYQSIDPVNNAIITMLKEVAISTNEKVGDGTTSSLILLQAILNEASKSDKSPREIADELVSAKDQALQSLKESSHKIKSVEDLQKVANISFNNPAFSQIIADIIYTKGDDSVVNIEESNQLGIHVESKDGFTISNGFMSHYMINTPKGEAVLDRPLVVCVDETIKNGMDMLKLLELSVKQGANMLFIVANGIEGDAMNTLIANKMKGIIQTVAVKIPPRDRDSFIEEIGIVTGRSVAKSVQEITETNFVKCSKVISGERSTVIIGLENNKPILDSKVRPLKETLATETNPDRKQKLEAKIQRLTGSVSNILLGAPTKSEYTAIKYKIEDSIEAVKMAYRHGYICGAGLSLARLETNSTILNTALKAPFEQLRANSYLSHTLVDLKPNEAIDARTDTVGDYIELGIIDPVEVLCAGLENAVSVATLLITMTGVIYEEQKHDASV